MKPDRYDMMTEDELRRELRELTTKIGIKEQILQIIDNYNQAEDVPAIHALRKIEALVR